MNHVFDQRLFRCTLLGLMLAVGLLSLSAGQADAALMTSGVAASKERSAGLQAQVSFKVTNRGDDTQRPRRVRVRMATAGGGQIRLGNVRTPRLGPGKSATLKRDHQIPDAAGAGSYEVQVCVRSRKRVRCSAAAEPLVIAPGKFEAAPGSVSYPGDVVGSRSTAETVTITNAGDAPTPSPQVALAGTNAADFEITGNGCGGQLRAGDSCTANVRFAPTAVGSRSARLAIGSGEASANVELTGTGLTQAQLSISPGTTDFGMVVINGTSIPTTYTVENTGGVPTSAVAVSRAGANPDQFATAAGSDTCTGQTLDPGETCTVGARFNPTSRGTKSTDFGVSATTGGTDSAALTGFGANPGSFTLSPTSHNFGSSPVGTPRPPQTFTATNTGDLATQITGTGGNGNVSDFSRSSDNCFGQFVAGGASCTFVITFTPTQTSNRSMTWTIGWGMGGTVSSALSGFGTP